MKKTILITGSSSGFGKLIAKKFHSQGWNVIATMRSPEKETDLNQLEDTLVCELDVTKENTISSAIEKGLNKFGKIDALINNAGFALQGPLEEISLEQMKSQFDVNLFGLAQVSKAILPHFREQKEGVIVNISSMAGKVTFPFTSLYHASKFAVEGLTEALQYELEDFGIKVKLVEPGAYPTKLMESGIFSGLDKPNPYSKKIEKINLLMKNMTKKDPQDPQEVADITFKAVTDEGNTLRYPVGADTIQMFKARSEMNDEDFKNMISKSMGLK